MWSEIVNDEDRTNQRRVARLQNAHRAHYGWFLFPLFFAFAAFVYWANTFQIDEVARAGGEVIASNRVQVIQSVDGGVLEALQVREGDRVTPGQELARLDQARFGASVGEIEARLFALRAKSARLRAEVLEQDTLTFPDDLLTRAPETAALEAALFTQRKTGLEQELRTLNRAFELARVEANLVEKLYKQGDASGTERLRVQRNLNEADAKRINTRNKFMEEARLALAKTDDEISQNEQILARRLEEQAGAIFTAMMPGIVKNIRVTTVGGVLRAGEELMQIIPVDDDLLIEAKISPADISRVRPGQDATIRFDPFDYTIYGNVQGKVVYVSPDTLKEETARGTDIYYRVRVAPVTFPVTTSTGKTLDILPGMTGQVDIRAGERSLMDYLLKPLRKTLTESFGER